MMKKNRNIFCATRPPGHHALNTGKHEGFCFYNNVAIAAKYIQNKYNLSKILIVDWDYHHGNSTEYFFMMTQVFYFFQLMTNLLILELVRLIKLGKVLERD